MYTACPSGLIRLVGLAWVNRYLPGGSTASVVALELQDTLPIEAYAVAAINGAEHVLVADGPLAGTWLPSDRLVEASAG